MAREALAGRSTFIENFPLNVNRSGANEKAYFTFCYSPVMDPDGAIVGIMDTVIETTQTVQAQQRSDVLNTELTHRINS
jgi:hypothetical protein